MHPISGPWDVVFFTGDLVQSGDKEEFEKLEEFLTELWGEFNQMGSKPILFTVPGNHDLVRPDSANPVVKSLPNIESDEEICEAFWNPEDRYYRPIIDSCFANYENWFKSSKFCNQVEIVNGVLPGDFSSIVKINGIRLGVIGLNTTYLQLTGGDFKGKLSLDSRQFYALCEDVMEWERKTDLTVLLTHHDQSWLSDKSKDVFLSEISASGMFHAHFCGHLHLPFDKRESIAGGSEYRLRLGASLCGIEKTGEGVDRVHGYSAGSISLDSNFGIEKIWPRVKLDKMSGEYELGPDQHYHLNENNFIEINFPYSENIDSNELEQEVGAMLEEQNNILDIGSDGQQLNMDKLSEIPRFKIKMLPHHDEIRRVEQSKFVQHLRESRLSWIISDWGLGFDGFFSSVCRKLGYSNDNVNVFNLICEDASSIDEVTIAFQKQFNCGLEQFCQLVSRSNVNSILILNQIDPKVLEETTSFTKLESIIEVVLDFCPNISLVITSRKKVPAVDRFIDLKPLDIPQVRTYISYHPESGSEFDSVAVIEDLYRYSGGLPMHLDRIISGVQFASLKEVLQEESILKNEHGIFSERIPKALVEAVSYVASEEDRIYSRSFTLLKLLSVLENGQSFSSIKKYDMAAPFHIANVTHLAGLSLLETIQFNDVAPDVETKKQFNSKTEVIKILKIPKQVRDYVKSLISEDELVEILKNATTCLFGDKWREGRLKSAEQSPLSHNASYDVGNELIISNQLLTQSIKSQKSIDVKRSFKMGIGFCNKLFDNHNYHDCRIGIQEICDILKGGDFQSELAEALILYAKTLRMDTNVANQESINCFEEVLGNSEFELDKEQNKSIYINLALAHHSIGNKEKAIESAEKVMELSQESSGLYLQADSIIVKNKFEGKEMLSKLRSIERKARLGKDYIVANNIAYDIALHHTFDEKEKIKIYDKIIKTKTDTLNIIHSLISKAKAYIESGDIKKIKDEDKLQLSYCYSYLYFQRGQLLTECHEVLWKLLSNDNQILELLHLFRHSSFVWRISDKVTTEKVYVQELCEMNLEIPRGSKLPINSLNLEYFERRKSELLT